MRLVIILRHIHEQSNERTFLLLVEESTSFIYLFLKQEENKHREIKIAFRLTSYFFMPIYYCCPK